ncbi:hypothetical protein GCM10009789_36370 [Kribbella sancticallisti]|uniref:Uncharacterized protein n=1 Tax=Kribbella sancticallisti TaxID=460087 RepID=A0ABP4PJC8_9ACTN
MSSDQRLDLEFAYGTYQDSCRDLYSPHYFCRRALGHDGVHAAGFGSSEPRWEHRTDHTPHMRL